MNCVLLTFFFFAVCAVLSITVNDDVSRRLVSFCLSRSTGAGADVASFASCDVMVVISFCVSAIFSFSIYS